VLSLALRWTGNLLILGSLIGVAGLAYLALGPETPPPWVQDVPVRVYPPPPLPVSELYPGQRPAEGSSRVVVASQAASDLPITHLSVQRIGLEADVVPARLVERNGGTTWEVPAFKVGHAESTAGAGAPGNAVLLGHVTSLHSGNVFADLDQVRLEDVVRVFSDQTAFDYRVVSVDHVPRDDAQVLEQGATPTVSLITCTGIWLPTIWDYTERLVVRAERFDSPTQ
jgi:LPXTG-site transpeptidase (sortase) family protein